MNPGGYHTLTEDRLVILVKEDDSQAFAEVFKRYHHFLLIYADQLTGNQQESEDIIQEVFIRAWESRGRFDHSRSLFNYLKVSVRNGFLNLERSKASNTAFKNELAKFLALGYESADSYVIEKELVARLESIARMLPGKMGKVFLMTHFEYYDADEIAQVLGVSEKTVKNLLSQAVANIRLKMGLSVVLFVLLG